VRPRFALNASWYEFYLFDTLPTASDLTCVLVLGPDTFNKTNYAFTRQQPAPVRTVGGRKMAPIAPGQDNTFMDSDSVAHTLLSTDDGYISPPPRIDRTLDAIIRFTRGLDTARPNPIGSVSLTALGRIMGLIGDPDGARQAFPTCQGCGGVTKWVGFSEDCRDAFFQCNPDDKTSQGTRCAASARPRIYRQDIEQDNIVVFVFAGGVAYPLPPSVYHLGTDGKVVIDEVALAAARTNQSLKKPAVASSSSSAAVTFQPLLDPQLYGAKPHEPYTLWASARETAAEFRYLMVVQVIFRLCLMGGLESERRQERESVFSRVKVPRRTFRHLRAIVLSKIFELQREVSLALVKYLLSAYTTGPCQSSMFTIRVDGGWSQRRHGHHFVLVVMWRSLVIWQVSLSRNISTKGALSEFPINAELGIPLFPTFVEAQLAADKVPRRSTSAPAPIRTEGAVATASNPQATVAAARAGSAGARRGRPVSAVAVAAVAAVAQPASDADAGPVASAAAGAGLDVPAVSAAATVARTYAAWTEAAMAKAEKLRAFNNRMKAARERPLASPGISALARPFSATLEHTPPVAAAAAASAPAATAAAASGPAKSPPKSKAALAEEKAATTKEQQQKRNTASYQRELARLEQITVRQSFHRSVQEGETSLESTAYEAMLIQLHKLGVLSMTPVTRVVQDRDTSLVTLIERCNAHLGTAIVVKNDLGHANKNLRASIVAVVGQGDGAAWAESVTRMLMRLIFAVLNDNMDAPRGTGDRLSLREADDIRTQKRLAVLKFVLGRLDYWWPHFCIDHVCDDGCFYHTTRMSERGSLAHNPAQHGYLRDEAWQTQARDVLFPDPATIKPDPQDELFHKVCNILQPDLPTVRARVNAKRSAVGPGAASVVHHVAAAVVDDDDASEADSAYSSGREDAEEEEAAAEAVSDEEDAADVWTTGVMAAADDSELTASLPLIVPSASDEASAAPTRHSRPAVAGTPTHATAAAASLSGPDDDDVVPVDPRQFVRQQGYVKLNVHNAMANVKLAKVKAILKYYVREVLGLVLHGENTASVEGQHAVRTSLVAKQLAVGSRLWQVRPPFLSNGMYPVYLITFDPFAQQACAVMQLKNLMGFDFITAVAGKLGVLLDSRARQLIGQWQNDRLRRHVQATDAALRIQFAQRKAARAVVQKQQQADFNAAFDPDGQVSKRKAHHTPGYQALDRRETAAIECDCFFERPAAQLITDTQVANGKDKSKEELARTLWICNLCRNDAKVPRMFLNPKAHRNGDGHKKAWIDCCVELQERDAPSRMDSSATAAPGPSDKRAKAAASAVAQAATTAKYCPCMRTFSAQR